MRPQEERSLPPHTAVKRAAGQFSVQKEGAAPAITTNSPFGALRPSAPISSNPTGSTVDSGSEWPIGGLQEAQITAILRAMSFGHLALGGTLGLGGAILEGILQEPAFFGLVASGGMLIVCGLITMLAANRQQVNQSPLAFYLLPYADFAIVGLWLLLFGVSGPTVLFYAYVVVSAALLLGSRHAIALTGIAGAIILAMSLGQAYDQITPAITLPHSLQAAFTIVATMLALGLIVYVARLFSLNLDRFIALTNRQHDELFVTRRHMAEQQEQTQSDLEALSNVYARFMSGDTEARAPVPDGSLALAAHILNTLLDQMQRLLHASATRARMEERIAELTQAVERVSNGDATAFQALHGPTGTALDTLTLALARAGRQLILLQQALQHAVGGYTAVLGITADLSLLHQTLSNTDTALQELQMRSSQSAVHLHALLESEGGYTENRSTERPFLREMELRARQQSAGLELLRARLGHISAQLAAVETELRRIAEGMEQITRGTRQVGRGTSGGLAGDAAASSVQVRPVSSSAQTPDTAAQAAPGSRPPSGALRLSDALPRRFNGPLMTPDRLGVEAETSSPR